MKIKYGKGTTEYGPGVEIKLNGEEIAMAIYTYLTAHNVHINGAATIEVNGNKGSIYVDPSGYVIADGKSYSGRGKNAKYKSKYTEELAKEAVLHGVVELNWNDIEYGNYDNIRLLKEYAKEVLNKKVKNL